MSKDAIKILDGGNTDTDNTLLDNVLRSNPDKSNRTIAEEYGFTRYVVGKRRRQLKLNRKAYGGRNKITGSNNDINSLIDRKKELEAKIESYNKELKTITKQLMNIILENV
jgi:seryl-tRNA synthetase